MVVGVVLGAVVRAVWVCREREWVRSVREVGWVRVEPDIGSEWVEMR